MHPRRDSYPAPLCHLTPDDSDRLRALANSTLFCGHLPDWSVRLMNLAARIDNTIHQYQVRQSAGH